MQTIFLFLIFGIILATPKLHAAEKDSVTIGIVEKIDNLNPILGKSSAAKYVHQIYSKPLTYLDDNWKLVCGLCEKIPTIADGSARIIEQKKKKFLRADWKIKENIFWSDGQPVTGFDVFKTWIIASYPKTEPNTAAFANIRKIIVNKKNPRKFTIEYEKIKSNFDSLGFHVLPEHIEGAVFDEDPDNYRQNTTYNVAPTKKGLFNAGFSLTKKELPYQLAFERTLKNKKKLNYVTVVYYNSSQKVMTALQQNKIEMISAVGITPDDLVYFKDTFTNSKELSEKYSIELSTSEVFEHLDLNLRNPGLANSNVRKALSYAINTEELIAESLNIPAETAETFLHSNDQFYVAESVSPKFDLKLAKKLLEASGWKLLKNGSRSKANKILSLPLVTTEGDEFRLRVAHYLVKQWAKIGVRVELELQKNSEFFDETLKKAHFKGFIMYAWLTVPNESPRTMFYSNEIPTVQNGYTGQNAMGWINKSVDEILENYISELDFDTRKKMMLALEAEYLNDVPSIPLYWHPRGSIVPKDMKNYKLSTIEAQSTLTIDNWSY